MFQRGFTKKSGIWHKPTVHALEKTHTVKHISLSIIVTKSMHAHIYTYIVYILFTSPILNSHFATGEEILHIFSSKVFWIKVYQEIMTWMYTRVDISDVWYLCLCAMQGEGSGIPTGGLGINYHSPEAVDWLPGNDNMPDSNTVRLSSFDLHIINSKLYHIGLQVHVI